MIKVLFDYQVFHLQTHGGASRCFAELISNFPADIHPEISIKEGNNVYLHDMNIVPDLQYMSMDRSSFLGGTNCYWKEFIFNALNYCPGHITPKSKNQHCSIQKLKEGDFDIFHPTFFDDYFIKYLNNKPYILTVHDLISEIMPKDSNRKDGQMKKRKLLIDKAAHIIAVSEHTKQDIINVYKTDPKKISVIYHGGPDIKDPCFDNTTPLFSFPYILYVGERNVAYKQFVLFVKACIPLLKENPELHIVCTGKDFNEREHNLFKELNIERQVVQHFANSDDLYNIYHHAEVFVYPSAYEGFGIPILEAFACGCPVLLNNASCFPEIASNAALFFNLSNTCNTLTDTLRSIINNPECQQQLRKSGYERLKLFSWKKSAEQLADIYKDICHKNS